MGCHHCHVNHLHHCHPHILTSPHTHALCTGFTKMGMVCFWTQESYHLSEDTEARRWMWSSRMETWVKEQWGVGREEVPEYWLNYSVGSGLLWPDSELEWSSKNFLISSPELHCFLRYFISHLWRRHLVNCFLTAGATHHLSALQSPTPTVLFTLIFLKHSFVTYLLRKF